MAAGAASSGQPPRGKGPRPRPGASLRRGNRVWASGMGMRARARAGRRAQVHHARGRARNRKGSPGQARSQFDVHGYVSVCLRFPLRAASGGGRRVLSLSETPRFRRDGGSRVPGGGRTARPAQGSRPAGVFHPPRFFLRVGGGFVSRHGTVAERHGTGTRAVFGETCCAPVRTSPCGSGPPSAGRACAVSRRSRTGRRPRRRRRWRRACRWR